MARLPNGEGEDSKGSVDRMRVFAVVALAVVASFLVAMGVLVAAAMLGLVAEAGPHQDFEVAAVTIGMAIVALGTAIIFSIVLVAGGRQTAARRTAVVLAVLCVAVLAAPEVFGLATTDPADVAARDDLGLLSIFLIVNGVPGLLTILVQWWIVNRYLFQGRSVVAPLAR